MRVLVTGATGFLGSYLVRALRESGCDPIPAMRAGADCWRLQGLDFDWCMLDMVSGASIQQAVARVKPDVLVNCAAYGVDYRQQDPQEAIAVNVAAVSSLVMAAAEAGVERVVHVGTCFEYGDKAHPIHERELLEPTTLYGTTKAAGTLIALERAKKLGLKLSVVRPFGVYGPLEGGHKLVPSILEACVKGEPIELTKGEQIRDYLFIGDVAEALVKMVTWKDFPAGEIFNVGSGVPMLLRDFVTACAEAFGGPSLLRFGARNYRRDEMMSLVADCSKWRQFYGESVQKTSLEQGLSTFSRPLGQVSQ